jgi:DNA-binding MarR family transcriptional regulator
MEPMKEKTDRRAQNAAKAWSLMFDFLMRSAPQRMESLQKRGLTPNDSRALFTLEKDAGAPIGALARQWGCDPSTATWLVDRLERAGFAKRFPSSEDRRVKLVRLTPKGARTAKELTEEYHRPPQEVVALPSRDVNELIRLFERLLSSALVPISESGVVATEADATA